MFLFNYLSKTKTIVYKSLLLFVWLCLLSGSFTPLSSSTVDLGPVRSWTNGTILPCADTKIGSTQRIEDTKSGVDAMKILWPKKKKQKFQKKGPSINSASTAPINQKRNPRPKRKNNTATLFPSVSLVATVVNEDSREQLTGIGIELYAKQNDRIESLLTKRTFGHGVIILTLNRELNYRLVIVKPGFHSTEVMLAKEEMKGLSLWKKEFELRLDESIHSIALPIMPEEVQNERSENPTAGTIPTISIILPVDTVTERTSANKDKPRVFVVYEVMQNSVLRKTPDEAAELLLSVQKGSRLELLEKTNALWYKVRFRDFTGFLPARMLGLEK
jgi:hypothetical protein